MFQVFAQAGWSGAISRVQVSGGGRCFRFFRRAMVCRCPRLLVVGQWVRRGSRSGIFDLRSCPLPVGTKALKESGAVNSRVQPTKVSVGARPMHDEDSEASCCICGEGTLAPDLVFEERPSGDTGDAEQWAYCLACWFNMSRLRKQELHLDRRLDELDG